MSAYRYSMTDHERRKVLAAYDAGWGFAKIARVIERTVVEVRAVVKARDAVLLPDGPHEVCVGCDL